MRADVRRLGIDWVPAIVVGVVALTELSRFEGSRPLVLATAVGVILPVGLRRERPLLGYALLVASIVASAIAFPENESIIVLFSVVICTYAVAQREETLTAAVAVTAGAAAVTTAIVRDPTDDLANVLPSVLLFVAAPAVAGWGLRRRNLRLERAADEAREAVEAERRRLARELHDVVAHAVTVIVIQAQAAQRLRTTSPDEELEALIAIEQRGRRALVELRRLLSVMRTDDDPGVRTPQPGIARIEALAAEMREAGLDVVLRIEGDVSSVPAGVDVSTYRIVQEALTNALRHAGRARANVLVRADEGAGSHRSRRRRLRRAFPRPRCRWRLRADRDAGARQAARRHAVGRPARSGRIRRQRRAATVIRVLLADDQTLVRTGFRAILGAEPDIEVVAEAADGRAAIEQTALHRIDVVLMDIRMPGVDGIEATQKIVGTGPRVLILTTFDVDELVYAALRAGASGFLLKDAPADQLLTAIRVVANGDALIDPVITRRLIADFARRPQHRDRPPQLEELTGRELEVLRLVARGLSNAEIAKTLFVGEATVKTHVGRVLQKLGLRDRVQAVVLAYECGLVAAGSADA